ASSRSRPTWSPTSAASTAPSTSRSTTPPARSPPSPDPPNLVHKVGGSEAIRRPVAAGLEEALGDGGDVDLVGAVVDPGEAGRAVHEAQGRVVGQALG